MIESVNSKMRIIKYFSSLVTEDLTSLAELVFAAIYTELVSYKSNYKGNLFYCSLYIYSATSPDKKELG